MDEREFAAFFRVMFPRLVSYAMIRVDDSSAQDVAAMALETLWRKRPPVPTNPDELDRLERLAYAICRGHLRNAVRSANRQGVLAAKIALHLGDGVAAPPTGEWATWLDALPTLDQQVLCLVAEGYRLAEIAVILDCSGEAVKKRLHRARRRARAALAARGCHDVV